MELEAAMVATTSTKNKQTQKQKGDDGDCLVLLLIDDSYCLEFSALQQLEFLQYAVYPSKGNLLCL